MNIEDRKAFDKLNEKVDVLVAGFEKVNTHLSGNGSGQGIFDRLANIERGIKEEREKREHERIVTRRWVAGFVVATIGLIGIVATFLGLG